MGRLSALRDLFGQLVTFTRWLRLGLRSLSPLSLVGIGLRSVNIQGSFYFSVPLV